MTKLVWVCKESKSDEIRLDGAVRTYYRVSDGRSPRPLHFPYIQTLRKGFEAVLSPVANSRGMEDTFFRTLEEAKAYVETAIFLGLEVTTYGDYL